MSTQTATNNIIQTPTRSHQAQNEVFFLKEFYNTFIEKIINALDTNGEISSYWNQVKQKMKDEKSFQQLYRFMLNFEIKKKYSSKLEIFENSKCNSMKTLSIPTLPTKFSKEEEQLLSSIKKSPTNNIKTVFIQFDVLSKNNNNNNASDIQQSEIPSLFNTPIIQASPSPLTVSKNLSQYTLKNGQDSPQPIQTPLSANPTSGNYNQGLFGSRSTQKIIDNIKKRNSTPGSPLTPQTPLNLMKNLSTLPDQTPPPILAQKQNSAITIITEPPQEKQPQKQPEVQSSNSHHKDQNQNQLKPQLKRFSPQQIMRMGSIREAEDEIIEEQEQKQNKEMVSKLLGMVTLARNGFKKDTETLNIIHGKFSLVGTENCKNSIGIDFLKLSPTKLMQGGNDPSKFSQKSKHNGLNVTTEFDKVLFGNAPNAILSPIVKSPTKGEKYYPK